jgi:Zn ribbon nucleic-acid-binding protein
MKDKRLRLFCLIIMALALMAFAVPAQEEYRLNVNKVAGFNNGSSIRGTFSAGIVGTEDTIQSVTFLVDGQVMSEVTGAPFKTRFETGDYGYGWHELSAQVHLKDGQTVLTAVRKFNFVSSEEESAQMQRLILPVIGGVVGVMVIGIGIQVLVMRKRPNVSLPLGAARKYGFYGGAICPKCQRPFSLHWWSFRLLPLRRFDRCDYCGQWALQHTAGRDQLAAAEQAELVMGQPQMPVTEKSPEEKLRDMVDQSKYTDGG